VILLDTHVLVWADSEEHRLGRKARALIERAWRTEGVAVCALSFWEVDMLRSRRRLRLKMPVAAWRASLLAAGLMEIPLDGAIALRAAELAGLPADPMDRFVVATAASRRLALMTADDALLEWRGTLTRYDARN
jgi:PIN domain nuclease of toxin-antitoxin system